MLQKKTRMRCRICPSFRTTLLKGGYLVIRKPEEQREETGEKGRQQEREKERENRKKNKQQVMYICFCEYYYIRITGVTIPQPYGENCTPGETKLEIRFLHEIISVEMKNNL